MFVGIIPLVIGAVAAAASVAGSLSAASSKKKQAAQVGMAVEAQKEAEVEVFALQQDTRLWQQNEQRWQRTREKINLGIQKKQAIFDNRIQARGNRLGRTQQVQGIKGQQFGVEQNAIMQEQGLAQEREGAAQAQQQTTAQGAATAEEIPGSAAFQTTSLQDLANMDRANLARESLAAAVQNQNSTIHNRMMQDQAHARGLNERGTELNAGALQTQLALVNAQKQAANSNLRYQRIGTRLETKGARLALRANALADKALTKNMDAAALADHNSKIAQLDAQMPIQGGGGMATLANVIGGIAPFAGQVAGTMNLGGGVRTPAASGGLDLSLSSSQANMPVGQAGAPPPYPPISSRPSPGSPPPYPGMVAPSSGSPPPFNYGSTLYSGFVPNNQG